MTNQTLYEILEVRQTATQDSIRASWERLSVKWDPTCTHNTNREARTRYAAITDAYLVLGNPQKRAAYDRKLSAPTQAPVQKTSRTVPATEAVHPRGSALPSRKSEEVKPRNPSRQLKRSDAAPAQQSRPRFSLVAGLFVTLAMGGYYYNGQRAQSLLVAKAATPALEAEAQETEVNTIRPLAYLERQREPDLAGAGANRRVDDTNARAGAEREQTANVHAAVKQQREVRNEMAAKPKELDASVLGVSEHRGRLESLALVLDTELAGHHRIGMPQTQKVSNR
ncbi:MAG: DnaJ domain-containing protein [Burkholderiales bacterium]